MALLIAIFRYEDIYTMENISVSDKDALYNRFSVGADGIRLKAVTGDEDELEHLFNAVAQAA